MQNEISKRLNSIESRSFNELNVHALNALFIIPILPWQVNYLIEQFRFTSRYTHTNATCNLIHSKMHSEYI